MKLKYQLAVLAAVAVLAGCNNEDQMGGQAQSNVPAATNEARNSANSAPTPAAPATPPKAPDQAGLPTPPPTTATPLATATNALANSGGSTNK